MIKLNLAKSSGKQTVALAREIETALNIRGGELARPDVPRLTIETSLYTIIIRRNAYDRSIRITPYDDGTASILVRSGDLTLYASERHTADVPRVIGRIIDVFLSPAFPAITDVVVGAASSRIFAVSVSANSAEFCSFGSDRTIGVSLDNGTGWTFSIDSKRGIQPDTAINWIKQYFE